MRIASFLPAATEMVYQLGLGESLVGVTHECDYPPEAKDKPVLVDCALDLSRMTMGEIDEAVSARIKSGKSLYKVDEKKLRAAAPDLLITQNLCQVCGPAGNEVSQVLKTLKSPPEILWQTPKNFDEVLEAYEELGRKTGSLKAAQEWVKSARERVRFVAAKTARRPKVRVSFIEWVDPVYCGGHWIPEMLAWAGGEDRNSKDGQDSTRIAWEDVLAWKPEILIVSPCGFKLDKALEQARQLMRRPGFKGKIFAVDANSYYARPGPRVVDGVELLAHLIHPEDFPWAGPTDAYRRVF